MLRRLIQPACIACLILAATAASAVGPGEAAVGRCFELRDSHPAAAVAHADEALAESGLTPDVEMKLRACLGRSLALTGDAGRAEAEVRRVDALLEQHPMPPEFVLRAMSNSGATLHTLGWTHRALDYYRRAHDAATRSDSDEAQATILANVASIHSETLGAHEQAEALYAQAHAARVRAGGTTPLLPYNRGINFLRMGRRPEALARFRDAERIASAAGHHVVEYRARAERIALEADGVTLAAAREALATIVQEQKRLDDPAGAATTLLRLSVLALRDQAPDEALAHAEHAAALVAGTAPRIEQQEALAAKVAAHAAQGDWRLAYEGVQALREREVSSLRRETLDNLAGLQARLNDTEREHEVQRLQGAQRIEALRLQNARRLRNVWIGAFLLLLLLGGVFAGYQRRVNRRLTGLSRVDPLTGLLNRRAATHSLEAECADPTEGGDRRDVVFLIDIDHFKARNDRYGHAAGDAALAEVARHLRVCCRPEDIVARWGGEEFLVGCRQLDLARAQQVAERLRTAVSGIVLEDVTGEPPRLSVSIGFACFPFFPGAAAPGDWQDAVALADRALYAGKHGGRDAWVGVWGRAGSDTAIADVAADPAAHVERGDVDVVASRLPVCWRAPAT
ncbi:GGDEF domain-containing protein [Luteimonas granuli]|nr:tetratricopeptide repeat-containing diguanylate cyclase [Luteimonas granuli]